MNLRPLRPLFPLLRYEINEQPLKFLVFKTNFVISKGGRVNVIYNVHLDTQYYR